MEYPEELRFLSYLSPGIPRAFFEAIVEHVRRALGQRASLSAESRVSGPMRGAEDPFSRGDADVGFASGHRRERARTLLPRRVRPGAFRPVTYEHYASEEDALRRCEEALGIRP